MTRRDTRQLILATALRLFNEHGTPNVSTNHICEACQISPGNLYYHFPNKEAIISDLFQRMAMEWEGQPAPSDLSIESFYRQMEQVLTFLWEYRFLHREFSSLLREDEDFRRTFARLQKRRLAEIDGAIAAYMRAKVLRTLSAEEASALKRLIWFFSLNWLPFLETEGKPITQGTIREGIAFLKTVTRPFLRPDGVSATPPGAGR